MTQAAVPWKPNNNNTNKKGSPTSVCEATNSQGAPEEELARLAPRKECYLLCLHPSLETLPTPYWLLLLLVGSLELLFLVPTLLTSLGLD